MSLPSNCLGAAAIAVACATLPARAAESYDNCTGFVDSLPATIATQGTWCLRRDLSTAMASGNAITIANNNITLDCNGFKLGGLAAGPETRASGIASMGRSNLAVRNCNLRGFFIGLQLSGGTGHVVEDNRFHGNTSQGISAREADTLTVRHNQVVDTGGNLPLAELPFGTAVAIAIVDTPALVLEHNSIGNVFATDQCDCAAIGISVRDSTGSVRGNQVTNLVPDGDGMARGIQAFQNASPAATRLVVRDNDLVNRMATPGYGFSSSGPGVSICKDNVVVGFGAGFLACTDAGGNSSH